MKSEYLSKVGCFKKAKHDFCHKVEKKHLQLSNLTINEIN